MPQWPGLMLPVQCLGLPEQHSDLLSIIKIHVFNVLCARAAVLCIAFRHLAASTFTESCREAIVSQAGVHDELIVTSLTH